MKQVPTNIATDKNEEIILSEVFNVLTNQLKEHPLNMIFNHEEQDVEILKSDIQKRGILVPLIVKDDNTILTGHRRFRIAKILKIASIPAQKILSDITPEKERELLFKDNIVRRQLKFKDKKEIIKTLYEHEIIQDHRGSFLKNQKVNSRYSVEYYIPLHIRIENEIGIPKGTVLRILADLRKEENGNEKTKSILKIFTKYLSSIEKLLMEQDNDFKKLAKKQIIELINHF